MKSGCYYEVGVDFGSQDVFPLPPLGIEKADRLSNALFIHSSDRSVSPVKSHLRLLQERIVPPPSPGSNQQVAVATGASQPLLAHTWMENRPVHNIGSDSLSPHLNIVANRKQSNLFVCASSDGLTLAILYAARKWKPSR
ncbi:hypothetical protein THAOC_28166 [Thalassiosira oceanica]|uniref:Uncharacterized protein n=1 Tax=Thalassiosira oceanica TaxID=159749 RepID=K0RFM3_THAOC|nr:hypothetical protein THAOC_28166 [Thalassiosira oceanica]|eukprot:EJK52543.1 hypothetical protein THAOC_28166 [Thalassiosira oceanica]